MQLAVWSPIGNAFVFVYENNIYYRSSASSEETVKLTSDGNFIYNGIPDWVYEGICSRKYDTILFSTWSVLFIRGGV